MSVSFQYRAEEMAVIVPTKDRPERVRRLLDSLAAQTHKLGQVIIVDGGDSIEDIVSSFADLLPVEWHGCQPPGQIRQRIFGLSKLAKDIRLVSLFDDDMVLESDAIEQMVRMWNSCEEETAGIAYNLMNTTPFTYRKHYALFNMSSPNQGAVLKSGFVTPIGNVAQNRKVQWLGGGYTTWRRDILDENPQQEVRTRWAVGEDVRFSYPIGKKFPLYVCAAAKVTEEVVNDYVPEDKVARYQGRKWALAHLYLVGQHPELSLPHCVWMLLGSTCFKLGVGLLRGVPSAVQAGMGHVEALFVYARTVITSGDAKTLLED